MLRRQTVSDPVRVQKHFLGAGILRVKEFIDLHENILTEKINFGNHVAYMELYIFKGNKFYETGKLSILVYQNQKSLYVYAG